MQMANAKLNPGQFRNSVEKGSTFEPESGRYHLYVGLFCPWATKTLIVRSLKGLEDVISLDILSWKRENTSDPFSFPANNDEIPGATIDSVNGKKDISEVYKLSDPSYSGRPTVPVLFDKKTNKIVNNESADIVRILNDCFNDFAKHPEVNLYPLELQKAIDEVSGLIMEHVGKGVYKCAFAPNQDAYEVACRAVFQNLDNLEERLAKSRYLNGDVITESDVHLFTPLIRFDFVYFDLFKCNVKRIEHYENLNNYLRELYQIPAFQNAVNFEHIKKGYYYSFPAANPSRIIPLGPKIDFNLPHNRHNIK
eukprot:TRINITY_DN2919_c0_g1_i1.p1 TRINITY_DN2919_c0_g1~~TRINITY_DN2919_c0_g1_i1.p1  ORF type:complete len:309 (-),score=50.24 TRINITY_DN2919_c0_g1_i1:64-990(-)